MLVHVPGFNFAAFEEMKATIQKTKAEDKTELKTIKKTHLEDVESITKESKTSLKGAEMKLAKQVEKLHTKLDQG